MRGDSLVLDDKTPLHPKIVQLDGCEVVGIAARTNNAKEAGPNGVIPKLWQCVMQEHVLDRVSDKTDLNLYAVYSDYANDANGDYTLVLGAKLECLPISAVTPISGVGPEVYNPIRR